MPDQVQYPKLCLSPTHSESPNGNGFIIYPHFVSDLSSLSLISGVIKVPSANLQCRLCLQRNFLHPTNIFGKTGVQKLLSVKIQVLTGIHVRCSKDISSVVVCQQCVTSIDDFWRYRQQCATNAINVKKFSAQN